MILKPEFYTDIPTYHNGTWTTTTFETHEQFRDFVDTLFSEPGKYDFDSATDIFNQQSRFFELTGYYCDAPLLSKDYTRYWNTEKDKCTKGVIVISGDKTWYLTRYYYFWLNFLKIFDKVKGRFTFATIYDTQYHVSLYTFRAILHHLNVAICKKRQIAMSYYLSAELINEYWFEEGAVLKIGASDKRFINDVDGTWKYLNEYANFLNANTAWYRPSNPSKMGNWQQKEISTSGDGKSTTYGNKSTIAGITFEKSPVKGIGGPTRKMFYEEGGEAPTADITYQFIKPALKMGEYTTGIFAIAGSVGQLNNCGPLKKFTYYPDQHGFMAVKTNLIDDSGTIGETALFIPEQWSMLPYIDEFGNSLVEKALEALDKRFADLRKKATPQDYQYEVSQHPRNLSEAFDFREKSVFPLHLVKAQLARIEAKEYPYEFVELSRDEKGNVQADVTRKLPISEYPLNPNTENKEGVLVVWERPQNGADNKPPWRKYYASIDPVASGTTTTSESLTSIYILRTPVEITKSQSDQVTTELQSDRIVATWCGRFDDPKKNHQHLELILEWYNCWTVYENNVTTFIQYLEERHKLKYLAKKTDMVFSKSMENTTSGGNVFRDYGWYNSGRLFKDSILPHLIEYIKEELSYDTKTDGSVVRTTYGIERIPDPMVLKEMIAYREDQGNYDRLVSLAALTAFVRLQQAHMGIRKERLDMDKNVKDKENLFKLSKNPFNNMGRTSSKFVRQAFKNLK